MPRTPITADQTAPRKRPDRRIERTQMLLRDALLSLVQERRWETITVQDIADRANVNRATFYLHYKDKDDLLLHGMTALYEQLMKSSLPVTRQQLLAGDFSDLLDDEDFVHVLEHAEFYLAMLGDGGSAAFINGVHHFLASMFRDHALLPLLGDEKPSVPVDFIAAYLAGAEVGVIRWWLASAPAHTPHEMAQMMFSLSSFGLRWALRLDEMPIDTAAFAKK